MRRLGQPQQADRIDRRVRLAGLDLVVGDFDPFQVEFLGDAVDLGLQFSFQGIDVDLDRLNGLLGSGDIALLFGGTGRGANARGGASDVRGGRQFATEQRPEDARAELHSCGERGSRGLGLLTFDGLFGLAFAFHERVGLGGMLGPQLLDLQLALLAGGVLQAGLEVAGLLIGLGVLVEGLAVADGEESLAVEVVLEAGLPGGVRLGLR